MNIDQDYLKKLLEACQASDKPTFDIAGLKEAGFNYNHSQFEFHMSILNDRGLIERDDGDPGFGLYKGADGFLSWSVLPLRLTASGHEFIEALSNTQVWAAIKHSFRNASLATLQTASQELLAGLTYNTVNNIVNNTANIGTAVNSPIQQAGAHSTQEQHTAYGIQERTDLNRLVTEFVTHLKELRLDAKNLQKATAQIATLQAQLAGDDPNPVIVRQAGRTLRNITEGAIAGLISTAAQPTVWAWVTEVMTRLFP